jgi:hypothetical protein
VATRKASDVAKALVDKGMTAHESHHTMFRKTIDGVTTVVTRISHGADTIGDDLGKRMANQCYLQLREFWELVDCTLSEDEWDRLITQRSVGGRNPFMGR